MKWEIFIGHAVFIASTVITLIILLVFKAVRTSRQRRSPLHGKQIGHLPGQQLLRRIDKADEEIMYGYNLMTLALPMLFLIWATTQIDWTQFRFRTQEALFLAGWVPLFGFGFWQYQRHLKRKEQARDGLLAERVTGIQLNRLTAKDCIVMHDLPCGKFNIDHVVIAPRGIFAVETKSFRKPRHLPSQNKAKLTFDGETLQFPDFVTRAPIEQARRQASHLANLLREALDEPASVKPAVSLPGWYVEKTGAGKSSEVFVFTPMGRGCEWFTYGEPVVSVEKRRLIAQALALRYPAIT
ncbi:nuclease-related domain-containing protein [Luteimonas abyssi]|uniref:nuclease-related domain-containing protein n=1 Tax=Luteimonas abyssi TaxID=1247514 RepID=UPI000737D393|nr:nuclease-related domain-containing protein [Luteimonas abyssi]